jgi:uncharacterized protein YkwD
MRRPARLLATLAIAATAAAGLAVPQTTAYAAASNVDAVRLNGFEAALVADINAARRAAGIRALTVVPGTTDVARRWAWRMAGAQSLYHNPSLVRDLERAGSAAWTSIAENVGEGPAGDPDVLFRAYMNSPPHRANILDGSQRFIGVGVVERNGTAWNTVDFTNSYSSKYGHTRVPADGLEMDRRTVSSGMVVAAVESPDQRFTTSDRGSVRSSRVHFTGPSSRNDAAFTRLRRTSSHAGSGGLVMRDALDLSNARALSINAALHNPRGRKITVRVVLRRSFGDAITLGTVRLGGRHRWSSFDLPAAARDFRNTLALEVGAKALRTAGSRGRLALFDVRATS